jgi:hypothetical protein
MMLAPSNTVASCTVGLSDLTNTSAQGTRERGQDRFQMPRKGRMVDKTTIVNILVK